MRWYEPPKDVREDSSSADSWFDALWRVLAACGVALLAALVLRGFARGVLLEAFKIPSGAMLPTFGIGAHIFVDKLRYGLAIPFVNYRLLESSPERGDLVVFEYPNADVGTEPMHAAIAALNRARKLPRTAHCRTPSTSLGLIATISHPPAPALRSPKQNLRAGAVSIGWPRQNFRAGAVTFQRSRCWPQPSIHRCRVRREVGRIAQREPL